MAKKMKDTKLVPILEKAIANSEHYADGKLAKERIEVTKYYNGEKPEPLHAGDSKYVSRDVFEAVDSMRSTVLEAYLAHHRIVFFRPEKGETVQAAKAATEYCRHVFFKKNDGEDIMYDVVTDGLMKRMSVVKVYHERITEEEEYDFEGLTSDELALEVEGYTDWEFSEADVDPKTGLFSGTFVVKKDSVKICIEVIQPEDILVSSRSADLKDSAYVIHRVEKTKSQLLKMFPENEKKIEDINFSLGRDLDLEYEKQQRFLAVDDIIATDDAYQDAQSTTTLYEFYIRLDPKETGKSDLYRVCYAGGKVLEMEKVARMPFAAFVPLPVPHTWYGDNYAKSVIPVQNARTVLIRQIINHSLVTNNPRLQVLNGTVQNPNELLENRVGGLVNVRRMDGLAPIPQAPLNPFVFNLIQMIEEDREETTGISRLSQGMNKDAISTQNAEGMIEQLISQSQQRTKIIARRFGKFLRDVYLLIYQTAMDYGQKEIIEVTGIEFEINPSEWKDRTAASVELSLGYGEQQKESQKWVEIDQYLKADPILSAGYDYAKSYEVASRSLEARGIEDIAAFLTPPDEMEPPQPSPLDQLEMDLKKSQIELQTSQAKAILAKAETDKMRAEAELIRARADAQRKADQSMLEGQELTHDAYMDRAELTLAQATPAENQKASFNLND